MSYNHKEHELLRKIINDIAWEHAKNGSRKDSNTFAFDVFKKIEHNIREIKREERDKFIKLLKGLIMEKRGSEECDCSKGLGKCGCTVRDYNEGVEENNFAINLLIQTIEKDKNDQV